MLAAEAQSRGFYQAQKQAFLGDGLAYNWKIQRGYFPHFVAITDFLHVLCYVYLAAWAVGGDDTQRWTQYVEWLRACWQGRVGEVIAQLEVHQERLDPLREVGPPETQAAWEQVKGKRPVNALLARFGSFNWISPLLFSRRSTMPRRGRPRDLHKEQFWRQTLRRFEASRLSAAQFCRLHNLPLHSLWAWQRTLRCRDQAANATRPTAPVPPLQTAASDPLPFFVPLRLKPDHASSSDAELQPLLEVILPNGLRLRVPQHFDSDALQRFLRLLRGASC
jgi:hypothetical protein